MGSHADCIVERCKDRGGRYGAREAIRDLGTNVIFKSLESRLSSIAMRNQDDLNSDSLTYSEDHELHPRGQSGNALCIVLHCPHKSSNVGTVKE